MKKLMTIMAVAASALFAFGDVTLPSGTSVESYTGALDTTKNDSGSGSDSTYWLFDGDASQADLLVTNYIATAVDVPTNRPAQFDGQTNNNYLDIDTSGSGRLYRSIGVNDGTTAFNNTADIGDGLYLDTLVQFTAAEEEFKDDALTTGDKIAIEYVDQTTDDTIENPIKAFVIRAGYIVDDNETIATNYFATVPAGFNKDDWHRLTVRAVASIAASGEQKAGFIVYLDDVALEYSTDVECGVGFVPAPAVAEYYKADCHAIYPSAVQNGTAQFTLSAVAFNGKGLVDDISFTTASPSFIGKTVSFNLGSGEAITTLTIDGTDYDVTGMTSTNIQNIANATFTLGVTLATGYNLDTVEPTGCTYNEGTVTFNSGVASASLTINTTRNNFTYIDEDGDEQDAVTLTEALTHAKDGTTITLKFPYTVADWEADDFESYEISGDVTLDLAGYALDGGVGEEETELFYVDGSFRIIDSVGGGVVSYVSDYGAIYNDGDTFVGNTSGDIGATFDAKVFVVGYEGALIKGNFDAVNNSDGDDFLWEGFYEGSTAELNQAETYWVVTPQNTPQPTTYEVTWTLTGGSASATSGDTFEENDEIVFTADIGKKLSYLSIDGVEDSSEYGASSYTYTVGTADAVLVVTFTKQVVAVPTALLGIVYDGTLKTGVVEQTGFTLTGNTAINAGTYEATATLAQGYIWSDSSTEAKSINWSIAAKTDATVYVTLSSYDAEYSAQLEFPTVMANVGNEAVFGTTAWDPASIVEPSAAGVTNDYTVTFTVTNGNYTGSTGTATFKVWKAASGGEDWPADPTTVSGQTAAAAFGISGDLANADAGVLATWAKANSVNYSDRTTTILTDAFLLDCANTQEAVDAAKANFKVTAITVVGDTVTITPADAADYGNGKIVIEGAAALTSPMSWHVKTTGDHFFRATLVVKPVTP